MMLKEKREMLKDKYYGIMAKITGGMMLSAAAIIGTCGVSFADKFSDAAEDAARGIQGSAEGIVKWLIVIILVVLGIIFMIGTQQQKEQAKAGIALKVVGAAIVVGAIALADVIFKWF